jgi:hypothetical protein
MFRKNRQQPAGSNRLSATDGGDAYSSGDPVTTERQRSPWDSQERNLTNQVYKVHKDDDDDDDCWPVMRTLAGELTTTWRVRRCIVRHRNDGNWSVNSKLCTNSSPVGSKWYFPSGKQKIHTNNNRAGRGEFRNNSGMLTIFRLIASKTKTCSRSFICLYNLSPKHFVLRQIFTESHSRRKMLLGIETMCLLVKVVNLSLGLINYTPQQEDIWVSEGISPQF